MDYPGWPARNSVSGSIECLHPSTGGHGAVGRVVRPVWLDLECAPVEEIRSAPKATSMKLNIETFKVQPVISKSRRELKTSQTGARLTSPKKSVGGQMWE